MSTLNAVGRRHALRSLVAGLSLAPLMMAGPARAEVSPDQAQAFVENASRELVKVVNGPGTTEEKATAFQKIINEAVDINSVGRFCLGRYWRVATPEQQKDYIELFHRVLVLNITGKVGEYKGVAITIVHSAPREDGVAVTSTVTRPGEAPTRVDWLVSSESGGPRIVDVIAEGTSLRLTQRNDYASYMSRNNNSVAALIDALKKQATGS